MNFLDSSWTHPSFTSAKTLTVLMTHVKKYKLMSSIYLTAQESIRSYVYIYTIIIITLLMKLYSVFLIVKVEFIFRHFNSDYLDKSFEVDPGMKLATRIIAPQYYYLCIYVINYYHQWPLVGFIHKCL